MVMATLREAIQRLPKVELHIHLEGAIPPSTLVRLVHKYHPESTLTEDELKERFTFTNFHHFLENWVWMTHQLREYDDFEQLAYDVLSDLAEQNVVYAEPFFSPGHYEDAHGLSVEKITAAVLRGAERAKRDHGIHYNFIIDLIRQEGAAKGLKWLNEVTPFLGNSGGVVGVGIGGDETHYPPELYTEVYAEARRRGFRLTAHAGEAAGVESIRGAVYKLGVERIGHGVRCVEDEALMNELRERKIVLEVCPTSNVKTGVVKSFSEHPVRRLVHAGLIVTINSDDPTFFQCTIESEYMRLAEELGFSIEELQQLSRNALAACWLAEDIKKELEKFFFF